MTIRIGGSASPKMSEATTPRSSLISCGWPISHVGQRRGILDVQPQLLLRRLLEHGRLDDRRLLRVAVGQDQHAGALGGRLHGLGRRGKSREAALLAAKHAVQVVFRLAAEDEMRSLFRKCNRGEQGKRGQQNCANHHRPFRLGKAQKYAKAGTSGGVNGRFSWLPTTKVVF